MSQSLTMAFNLIVSDTVSNTRRTPFGGSTGWEAASGINLGQYTIGADTVSVGDAALGIVLVADSPVDVSATVNGTDVVMLAQTVLVLCGPVTGVSLSVTAGYTSSLCNVATVS